MVRHIRWDVEGRDGIVAERECSGALHELVEGVDVVFQSGVVSTFTNSQPD